MTPEELKVIELMESRGGGFVKALANCFKHADRNNFNKLKIAFLDYWVIYAKQATPFFKK